MKIHVDADLLVYRCGFAAERMKYRVFRDADGEIASFDYKKDMNAFLSDFPGWEEQGYYVEQQRVAEPVENALHNVGTLINTICEQLECTPEDMVLYLSGGTNFREDVATLKPYKGNRDPDHKPTHTGAIKEYMHKHYEVVVSDNEEADDVIGYTHYGIWLDDPYGSVIVSNDKDMRMIPGMHYNYVKDERDYIELDDADKFFYIQLLTGDSTDNIPGVPGIGPAKAAKAYAECVTNWDRYLAALAFYVKGYGEEKAEEALLENARLLWIRRHPEELWEPPLEDNIAY